VRDLLLADTEKAQEHIRAMFELNDDQKKEYANQFVKLIRKIEQTFDIQIYPSDQDNDLHNDTVNFLTDSQNQMIATFSKNLWDIRNSARTVKANFKDFDYGLDLYFNRHMIPAP